MVYHSVNGFFALRKNEWVFVVCKGSGGWTLPEETAKKLPDTQLYLSLIHIWVLHFIQTLFGDLSHPHFKGFRFGRGNRLN